MAKRYTVTVSMQISGSVEVEADSEDRAAEIAAAMDYDEWEEVCVDNTEVIDDPELLSEVCEHCDEDVDECTCEVCEYCDERVEDCECDVCEGCEELVLDCVCEDEDEDENE